MQASRNTKQNMVMLEKWITYMESQDSVMQVSGIQI